MDAETVGWLLVAAGLALALIGRHVFWLAVGLVGFLVTCGLAVALLPDLDPVILLLLAGVIGVLGAIVTLGSLRLVAAVVGALLLGVVARAVFVLHVDQSAWQWLAFGVGLVVGFTLVRLLFDIGIIVTTALGGGWYVARGLTDLDVGLSAQALLWVGVGVALVGAAVQTSVLRRRRRTPARPDTQ